MYYWTLCIDLIGWIGAIIGLSAYFMVSTNRLSGTSFMYQSLNVLSAILVLFNSYWHGALPSASVNFFWILISLYALRYYTPELTKKEVIYTRTQESKK